MGEGAVTGHATRNYVGLRAALIDGFDHAIAVMLKAGSLARLMVSLRLDR